MAARIMGADISLNHGGLVLLEKGKLSDVRYYTDIAGAANRSKKATRLVLNKKLDKQIQQIQRLAFIRTWYAQVLEEWKPDYVGLEDYAIRAEYNSHPLGEAGGAVRLAMWDAGVRYRLSDPMSSKMFVTHDGNAQKDLVEREVEARWGVDFSEYNGPPSGRGKPNRTTSEDLADAFGLAKLVRTEVRLRSGAMKPSDLHPKEWRVFMRVTKTYPTNILDREWISRHAVEESAKADKRRLKG